ncbi:MAG: NAD(P)/FAD-dependent oxidoreductase [Chitinophagales bacterium]
MKTVLVLGGGAAGFFYAINKKLVEPATRIIIWERSNKLLEKVRISGGGRCNVTHACFDPRELSKHYPRGEKELLGPFYRFHPQHTIQWFEERGVAIQAEEDGRMFPTTNKSETIAQCLLQQAAELGIHIQLNTEAEAITFQAPHWRVQSQNDVVIAADEVMVATGPSLRMWKLLEQLGYRITPSVPSLFTFNCADQRIKGLLGLSVPSAQLRVSGSKWQSIGPLLITHWGFSGPAVLKLSAWGAREWQALKYRFELRVNWCGEKTQQEILEHLTKEKETQPKRTVISHPFFHLPRRLWERLAPLEKNWADVSKKELLDLAAQLSDSRFQITGKSTFKDEFVTAGGVALDQINFKNFESKLHPGLFFAGEVLDIDAITGGFNFQAAWTGAWLAAQNKAG